VQAQLPETGETRPAAVFGGSCDAVLPPSELAGALGSKHSARELVPEGFAADYAVAQIGGLRCAWEGDAYILATLWPEAAAVESTPRGCGTQLADMDGDIHCDFDVTVNGTRIAGLAAFTGLTKNQSTATLADVLAVFTASANAAEPVPLPIPAPESWSNPVSCSFLEPLVSDPTILNGAANPVVGGAPGRGAYYSPIELELRGILSDPMQTECTIYAKKPLTDKQRAKGLFDYLGIEVVGGAAWAQNDVEALSYATETTIEGADRAFVVKESATSGYGTWFAVFDGPNYLSVRVDDTKAGRTSIAKVLAAID